MKVVGSDIERRKSNAPDRFFSHFYFGPDKHVASVSVVSCVRLEREVLGVRLFGQQREDMGREHAAAGRRAER